MCNEAFSSEILDILTFLKLFNGYLRMIFPDIKTNDISILINYFNNANNLKYCKLEQN